QIFQRLHPAFTFSSDAPEYPSALLGYACALSPIALIIQLLVTLTGLVLSAVSGVGCKQCAELGSQ
ncbi:MAG TPA: hypothetical protein IGS40_06480, partial [Trichormus sp. M33_DOE_039]|nr:hypothetical protein [Trichormus sp. M33_DOE_039]